MENEKEYSPTVRALKNSACVITNNKNDANIFSNALQWWDPTSIAVE